MYHNKIDIPDGDILIHAGDFLSRGSMPEFAKFAKNFGNIAKKFKHVIMTCGNHDGVIEKEEYICKIILRENGSNIHLLIDEEIILDGLKFYGSPRTIEFFNWYFMYPKKDAKRIWDKIPSDTDVLITHQPPFGKLDYVKRPNADGSHNVGCEELLNKILEVKPLLSVFGHLHHDGGKHIKGINTTYINAAICNEEYNPNRKPIIVDINIDNKSVNIVEL